MEDSPRRPLRPCSRHKPPRARLQPAGIRGRACLIPGLILALLARGPPPAAAQDGFTCAEYEAVFLPLAASRFSYQFTTDGCADANDNQICDIVGTRGPCSTISGCDRDLIAESDECTAANADTSCCVVTYVRDCGVSDSDYCTKTQPLGVCGQFCDSSDDGGGGGSNAGVAAGVSVGVILLVALAVGVGIFCYCRRKRSSGQVPQLGKVPGGVPGTGQALPPMPTPTQAYQQPYQQTKMRPQPPPPQQPSYSYVNTAQGQPQPPQYAAGPQQYAAQAPPPPPPPAAPQASAQGYVQPAAQPLHGQYAPPPPPPPPQAYPPGPYAAAQAGTAEHASTYTASQAGTVNARSTASATQSSAPPVAAYSSTGTHGTTTQPTHDSQPAVNPYALVATEGSTAGQSTFGQTTLPPRRPPAAGAPMDTRKEFLHYQLDTLAGREVLGGLVLEPGMSNRMQGGQAIIQFAKDRRSGLLYALKFFLSTTAFGDEVKLYTDQGNPLGHFLPQLRNIAGAVGHGAPVVDAHGQPLPPCIVMEKGESLDMWMKRNRDGMDMVTGLQVIQHVAERLSDLHRAGFAHRDLKQSNVMWLPRENRWTLIDFGCAARIGEAAPLAATLKYSPPEVVWALQQGVPTVTAAAAMDAWALGIIAMELLTRRNVLAMMEGRDMVMAKIIGRVPLPWEHGADGSQQLLHKLGRFRGAVLGLLHRDPLLRLDAGSFVRRCRAVLEHTRMTDMSSTLGAARPARPARGAGATERLADRDPRKRRR